MKYTNASLAALFMTAGTGLPEGFTQVIVVLYWTKKLLLCCTGQTLADQRAECHSCHCVVQDKWVTMFSAQSTVQLIPGLNTVWQWYPCFRNAHITKTQLQSIQNVTSILNSLKDVRAKQNSSKSQEYSDSLFTRHIILYLKWKFKLIGREKKYSWTNLKGTN